MDDFSKDVLGRGHDDGETRDDHRAEEGRARESLQDTLKGLRETQGQLRRLVERAHKLQTVQEGMLGARSVRGKS